MPALEIGPRMPRGHHLGSYAAIGVAICVCLAFAGPNVSAHQTQAALSAAPAITAPMTGDVRTPAVAAEPKTPLIPEQEIQAFRKRHISV